MVNFNPHVRAFKKTTQSPQRTTGLQLIEFLLSRYVRTPTCIALGRIIAVGFFRSKCTRISTFAGVFSKLAAFPFTESHVSLMTSFDRTYLVCLRFWESH
ncbi:hypothetical protein EVAR_44704_1 [Eumeta japonica]|uniref:Uncharacterized protein n=1 Tax=Eumeta variegata TaxID=151549 RepID=A0A4C1XKN9_EUMVA|nr:hypothetical protein EVAR_44704_1 [Eumeta japonica]